MDDRSQQLKYQTDDAVKEKHDGREGNQGRSIFSSLKSIINWDSDNAALKARQAEIVARTEKAKKILRYDTEVKRKKKDEEVQRIEKDVEEMVLRADEEMKKIQEDVKVTKLEADAAIKQIKADVGATGLKAGRQTTLINSQRKLLTARRRFVAELDLPSICKICIQLKNVDLITSDQWNTLTAIRTAKDKVRMLLDIIHEQGECGVECLVAALESSDVNRLDLAMLLRNPMQKTEDQAEPKEKKCQEVVQEKKHQEEDLQLSDYQRKLQRARPILVREMREEHVSIIVDEMMAERDGLGFITIKQWESIEAATSSADKVRKLLGIVFYQGRPAFNVLLRALESPAIDRRDLALMLMDDYQPCDEETAPSDCR